MPPAATRVRHTKPVPGCAACNGTRVCPYHSSSNTEELTKRFGEDLLKSGCGAVADFYGAGFAALELLPTACLAQVNFVDPADLHEEMASLSRKKTLNSDEFRRLGALALAIATTLDVMDSQQDQEDEG